MTELDQLRPILDLRNRWDGFEGETLRFASLSLASALEEAFQLQCRSVRPITSIRGYVGDHYVVVDREQILALSQNAVYRDDNGDVVKAAGRGEP